MTAQEKQRRREPAYSRRVVVDPRGLASSCLCLCSCGARTAQSRQTVQDETRFARSFAMLFSVCPFTREHVRNPSKLDYERRHAVE